MSGSERLIDKLITFTENDPGFYLDSISCLQMPSSNRDKITQTILTECSKIKVNKKIVSFFNNNLIYTTLTYFLEFSFWSINCSKTHNINYSHEKILIGSI